MTNPALALGPPAYNFLPGPCTFGPDVRELGDPATTTVLSGGQTFSGTYHVIGSLRLEAGTYTVLPGTVFYVESLHKPLGPTVPALVRGRYIELGKGATLDATDATFRAACDQMWYGIRLAPDEPGQVLHLQNCTIGQALYGVFIPPSSQSSQYTIDRCDFYHNLRHIYDEGRHEGYGFESYILRNFMFSESDDYMLAPYANPVPHPIANRWFMYEAIHAAPYGIVDGSDDVTISGNTIRNAVYGIVNNQPGRADLLLDDNTLQGIFVTGIWFDDTKSVSNVGSVELITSRATTKQFKDTDRVYGLRIRGHNSSTMYVNVLGDSGQDTINKKVQTGIWVEEANAPLRGNTLTGLTYGLSVRDGYAAVGGNTFADCWRGIRVLPNAGVPSLQFTCNDFTNSQSILGVRGIWVQNGAFLNNQGSFSEPAGNRIFPSGSMQPVWNDGTNTAFSYTRYSTEQVPFISGNTGGSVLLGPATPSYACANRQYGFVGVQNRGTGVSAGHIAALMDTVQWQAAPAARLRQYTAEILKYHLEQGIEAALASYAAALSTANPAAHDWLGLGLLRHYTYTAPSAAGAAGVRAWLLPTASPDTQAEARYLGVVAHLNATALQPDAGIPAADSVALVQLATGSSPAAELAAYQLRYYYPGLTIVPASELNRPAAASAAPSRAATLSQQLAFDLYPSPAHGSVRVRYMAAAPQAGIVLQLTDLLTGNVARSYELTGKAAREELDLTGLRAGQYGCRLVVNGQVGAMRKLVIN